MAKKSKKAAPTSSRLVLKNRQVNFMITEEGRAIMEALRQHYGLSQGGLLEMLIRDRAREVNLFGESQPPPEVTPVEPQVETLPAPPEEHLDALRKLKALIQGLEDVFAPRGNQGGPEGANRKGPRK